MRGEKPFKFKFKCPLQASWAQHKACHKPAADAWLYCLKRGRARSDVMPDFAWTGPLRPFRVAPARPVREGVGRASGRTLRRTAEPGEPYGGLRGLDQDVTIHLFINFPPPSLRRRSPTTSPRLTTTPVACRPQRRAASSST